jgi:hypothetical protein
LDELEPAPFFGGGVSEERLRRLAAHYACADEALIDALVAMATDRTRGWWKEYRGVRPPAFAGSSRGGHGRDMGAVGEQKIPDGAGELYGISKHF